MRKKVDIRMKIRTLFYAIKQGFINIKRNRMFSLASIGTIMASLFLFGIFYFIISNFQYMIHTAEKSVGITVFFQEDLKEEQIKKIGDQIGKRKEVAKMEYISPEEAWAIFKREYFKNAKELTDTFAEDNPLETSASYAIYLKDVSKQPELVKYIKKIPGVREVNSSEVTARSLSSFNLLVAYVSVTIIIILIAVAIFLISTTVTMGISVRKDEIAIMKLIGATDFFVRAPFVVEGVLIGLIGAIIPLGILYVIYHQAVSYIMTKFHILSGILHFLTAKAVFHTLVPVSLCIGMGIGFLGSFFTVKKHLQV